MKAEQRHYAERAKKKAERKLRAWGLTVDPKRVGKHAAMHGTCPCWMCTRDEPKLKPSVVAKDRKKLEDLE